MASWSFVTKPGFNTYYPLTFCKIILLYRVHTRFVVYKPCWKNYLTSLVQKLNSWKWTICLIGIVIEKLNTDCFHNRAFRLDEGFFKLWLDATLINNSLSFVIEDKVELQIATITYSYNVLFIWQHGYCWTDEVLQFLFSRKIVFSKSVFELFYIDW